MDSDVIQPFNCMLHQYLHKDELYAEKYKIQR